MSVQPLSLQNLFLRSDQLSREIAQSVQAAYLQQDDIADTLVRKSRRDDAQVHEVDKPEDDALKVGDDGGGATPEGGDEDSHRDGQPPLPPTETVSEDYIGKRVDIRK